MRTLLATSLVATTLMFAPVLSVLAASHGPYLFQLLKKPPYRRAWTKMVSDAPNAPAWVKAYARTFDGPSSPSETLALPDGHYLLALVCKAHDCGHNQLRTLFAPGGHQAWGLLSVADRPPVWLGTPPAAVQAALSKAAAENRP